MSFKTYYITYNITNNIIYLGDYIIYYSCNIILYYILWLITFSNTNITEIKIYDLYIL